MEFLEKALYLKTELDRLRPLYVEPEAASLEKSGSDWMYRFNYLEGTSFSFKESKEWLLWGFRSLSIPLAPEKLSDDFFQWMFRILKEDHSITEDLIKKLHALIIDYPDTNPLLSPVKPVKKAAPGNYKSSSNNSITNAGTFLKFATPEETAPLMYELVAWYADQKISYHVNGVLLAVEFHYKLIRIHPFEDGNIRIARLLMNLILMKFNFPPLHLNDTQEDYFKALQKADQGNRNALNEYVAQNVIVSMERMMSDLQRLRKLTAD